MTDTPVNQDQLTTKEQLNLETAKIEWKALEVFFAQGKLLIVDNSADLVEVAAVIGDNQVNKLESLITENKVAFATPAWIKDNCTESTILWAVVVSPYVVAQLAKD